MTDVIEDDDRLQTWSLEAHVVTHCNLRCAHCCTRSPDLPVWAVDPDTLHRDLTRAATALAPTIFKLTGGEPLLHPALMRCVEAARASGISPRLSMTTNGLRARQAPEGLWAALDQITLSWYASAPLPEATLNFIEDRCADHGVMLNFKPYGHFQRLDAEAPHDAEGAAVVWAGCWLKHRCHLIDAGHIYPCTRAPRLAEVLHLPGGARVDGEPLEGPDLVQRLRRRFIEGPLEACAHCLGGQGEWLPHTQRPSSVALSDPPPQG